MCYNPKMAGDEQKTKERLEEIEKGMQDPAFWSDKTKAQEIIREYNELKDAAAGVDKYDRGGAIMTIFAGAGGDDAEDFARMLYEMYDKYIASSGWTSKILHDHATDAGGYRSITLEIEGKNVYGTIKNESGVHRLVRISPFNASKKRHTSFVMVEVVPKIDQITKEFDIPEGDIKIEFAKSGGPGGQNVNKRETAVRAVHVPSNISVHVSSERSQQANRDKALAILKAKMYHSMQEAKKREERGLSISSTTSAEWGNQIRSYVLHPYQMVKDHRTGVEVRDISKILERGELDEFIEAEQSL
jgi:peptide chain release factor 2